MRTIFFIAQLLLAPFLLKGQQDLTLYNLSTVPQLRYSNPALTPTFRYYIALPVVSSIYANFSHNGFVFSDAVKRTGDDSLYLDIDNVIGKLGKTNTMAFTSSLEWLALGWKMKSNYYFFNISERIHLRFRYPKDLISLLWQGNSAFVGQTADFGGLGVDYAHYREFAFGLSRSFGEKLTVALKPKYLYGVINVQADVNELSLNTGTAEENYALTLKSDISLKTSGPFNDTNETEAAYYISQAKNHGFAADIGVVYKASDKIRLSASFTDIGFIGWKSKVKNYNTESRSAEFKGIGLNLFVDKADTTDPFQAVFDSLTSFYDTIIETKTKYKTSLITQMYIAGNYYINDRADFGLLIHGEFYKKAFYPSLTFSFNKRFGKWFGATVSYSMYNGTFNNVGVGFSLNLGPLQFYAVSDNIFYLFDLGKTSDGVVFPRNIKNAHLRTGLNFTFGRDKKIKDKDDDGIPDKEDDCPKEPGTKEFAGCPDRDGDKIIDKYDDCPDDFGLAEFNGCPDHDGDGLTDKKDSCPDAAGLIINKGCPLKLYMVNSNGDTLMETSQMDEDSVFIFELIPDKRNFIFMLGAEDTVKMLIDEIKVMVKNEMGTEDPITVPKGKDNLYRYDYLPYNEPKLHLISEKGDTMMSAVKDENGYFIFRNLPADKNYLFLLDAGDIEMTEDLSIILIDKNGREKRILALKGNSNLYRYTSIPQQEVPALSTIPQEDSDILKESAQVPVATPKAKETMAKPSITFKVQIFAMSKQMKINDPAFKGIDVAEYQEGGLFKYAVGAAGNFDDAMKMAEELRNKGFAQAFVVAFKGNKKIPLQEAMGK